MCQPPCEAVSWNTSQATHYTLVSCQPPCEAVSWNAWHGTENQLVKKSASLWGCELKCLEVIVFEASICQPPCEAVSWNNFLPVVYINISRQPPCEAVSWNACVSPPRNASSSQPPCEAVSWNALYGLVLKIVLSSASLWGCELKYIVTKKRDLWHWSASLWGCELKYRSLQQQRTWKESASLWGCELKCGSYAIGLCGLPVSLLVRLWVEIHLRRHNLLWFCCQPPCEAVSWNRCVHYGEECVLCQPPCEAVSWNTTVIQASEVCMSQPPCEAVSWNTILVWMER